MGKFDRVLKAGDFANIPLTVAGYLGGAAWLYGWADGQHFSMNWQFTLVGVVLVLGVVSVAIQITDRVRGSSLTPKPTQRNVNPAQANIAHPTLVRIEELYRVLDGPMIRETEANVRAATDVINPPNREDYLFRGLTMLMVMSIYEVAWVNIFGSQLRALNQLNTRMLTYDELRHYYDEGVANLPQIYQNRPFEMWLAFMRNQVLVRENGDRYEITVRGREFLRYVVQSGYDQNAKLG